MLLVGRLRQAITALNPGVPAVAREDALKQVMDLGTPVLLAANRQFHRLLLAGVPVQYQQDGRTDIERRNRALLAFALMTGARDSALASMKLKHVDLAGGSVAQDAREVQTKFSKSFTTYFFNVGSEVRQIFDAWITHLRQDMLWGNDDPLFPATLVELGQSRQFEAAGLARRHWSTASPIRAIFKEAFEAAGLPYFNPHSFRATLVQFGETVCQNPEQFKAWSQNLGHEGVLTTFLSYGAVAPRRQGQIIQALATAQPRGQAEVVAQAVVQAMRGAGLLGGEC